PRQKAYEDCKEQSHDETAGNSPPKFGFDRRCAPLRFSDVVLQFAISFVHRIRPGSEITIGTSRMTIAALSKRAAAVIVLMTPREQVAAAPGALNLYQVGRAASRRVAETVPREITREPLFEEFHDPGFCFTSELSARRSSLPVKTRVTYGRG